MRGVVKRPGYVALAVAGGIVVLGGAGALRGPAWAAAGVVAGPVVGLAAVAVVRGLTIPDPADLLQAGGHREALRLVEEQLPAWRLAARLWPGQFRDALAVQLMNKSMALLAIRRHGEALAAAEQSVAIFRSLAAARPGQPSPGLAFALNNLSYPLAGSLGTQAELLAGAGRPGRALAATSEATGLYQDIHPADRSASGAAHRAGHDPAFDSAVFRTAHRADPAAFLTAWHAVTGTTPPSWLTTDDDTPA